MAMRLGGKPLGPGLCVSFLSGLPLKQPEHRLPDVQGSLACWFEFAVWGIEGLGEVPKSKPPFKKRNETSGTFWTVVVYICPSVSPGRAVSIITFWHKSLFPVVRDLERRNIGILCWTTSRWGVMSTNYSFI